MKVVHAVGWYFPESLGGTEIYVAAVARELRCAGVDVRIGGPSAGASSATTYDYDGVPVFRYPIPSKPTRAEARGEQTVRGTEAFHEWLRAERPDVVHIHTFVTGLDLIEIQHARAAGARVFVTSHSSALGWLCLRGTLLRWGDRPCDGLVRPFICAACALQARGVPRILALAAAAIPPAGARLVDRLDHPVGTAVGLPAYIRRRQGRQHQLFDHIDTFFALTGAARDMLIANGAPSAKVVVNRLGIDTNAIAPHALAQARRSIAPITIGYLGRLDPIKGIDDLLRAVRSLSGEVPIRLEVRGPSHDDQSRAVRAACEAAARADSRITFGGAVARGDVSALLATWDLLCCPGLTLEGGPTVALEAMSVGTPVIGARFGGLAELVTDGANGGLVDPGDWRALAGVIRTVAERPSIIDQWRARLPAVRSMGDVARDYLMAYSS